MIVTLGDLHFRTDYPWFKEATREFLKWFESWELNNNENTLVLLGDLVHFAENGGQVIDYLYQLLKISSFKEIHIPIGNHDYKRINNEYQLAYQFLERESNIFIYKKDQAAVIEGISCIFLPYLYPSIKIPTPSKYYSNLYKKYNNKFDIIFGHITDNTYRFDDNPINNLNKLGNKICLGHIHIKVSKNYLGSIMPLNYAENGQRYYATFYKKNNKIYKEEKELPKFLEFKMIEYGEDPYETNALVSVYTINNCPIDNLLDIKYKDIYIKKYNKRLVKDTSNIKSEDSIQSISSHFKQFIKENPGNFNRNSIKICKEALSIS